MGNFFESEDPSQLTATPPPFGLSANAAPNPNAPKSIETDQPGGGPDIAAIQKYLQSGEADTLMVAGILHKQMKDHPHLIIYALDNLPFFQSDNLAYNLVARTTPSDLAALPQNVLDRLYKDLTNPIKTISHYKHGEMAAKVRLAMGPEIIPQSGQPEDAQTTQEPQEPPRGMTADLTALQAEWNGTITKENGIVSIWEKGTLVKTVSLATMRASLTTQFNWSGIVKLMTDVAASTNALTYTSPTNLQGNDTDNARIMPDAMLAHLVYLQVEAAKAGNKPVKTYVTDGAKILGGTQLKDMFCTGDTKADYMDQREEANKPENRQEILDLDQFGDGGDNQKEMYDKLRNIVLSRNGLWSDEEQVTNILSIRNTEQAPANQQKGTDVTPFNDFYFVVFKDGENYHVSKYKGSTEPGDLGNGMIHSDQTLTMKPGVHQSKEPGGRTSYFLRKSVGSNDNAFSSNTSDGPDPGMNFHRANVSDNIGMKTNRFTPTILSSVFGSQNIAEEKFPLYRISIQICDLLAKNGSKSFNSLTQTEISSSNDLSEVERLLGELTCLENSSAMTNWVNHLKSMNFDDENYSSVLVKTWSKGCQVFEKSEGLYGFLQNSQQFSEETGQRRWYYSIIDLNTLTIVAQNAN